MATSRLNIFFMATIFVLVTSISAKEYVVGDENGWKLDFDYQNWAKDKVFYVGDTLASNGIMTSGQDVVPLQTPGRKWYICGVGKHCELRNMKLVITVLPQTWAPAPSPIATSTSGKLAVQTLYGFVVGLLASLLLLLV
ncbi:putative cupredoxin, phytocyanin [Helianthus anomalus]